MERAPRGVAAEKCFRAKTVIPPIRPDVPSRDDLSANSILHDPREREKDREGRPLPPPSPPPPKTVDRKSDARPKEASQVFQSRIMSGHGLYRRLANRGRDKIAPAPGIYAGHKFALYMSVHGKCDDGIARRSRRIRP